MLFFNVIFHFRTIRSHRAGQIASNNHSSNFHHDTNSLFFHSLYDYVIIVERANFAKAKDAKPRA